MDDMKSATENLAEFAVNLQWEDIPENVRENAKLRTLDIVGLCLASTPMDYYRIVLKMALAMGGAPGSTVIGKGIQFPPALAALVNGTAAHGLDFDDTHTRAVVHASSCIIPAALAVAEANRKSGKDFVAAAVAGYETIVRLGAAAPGAFHARGFHASSVAGTFAAALVAGKLLGFQSEKIVDAMGISGSQAAGLLEFLEDGSWVKRVHTGWAAHSGIIAAFLARYGMTGPRTILEGKFGLYRSYVDESMFDAGVLSEGLGVKWETPEICFKPYPACHLMHGCLDCVAAIKREHGIGAEDVKEILCRVPEEVAPIICEPESVKLAPRSDYEGKFSVQFSVAALLVTGRINVDTYEPSRMMDDKILRTAKRVRYESVPDTTYPEFFPGEVIVTLNDGTRYLHKVEVNRGMPGNPMTRSELIEKFCENAGRVLPEDRLDGIIKAVDELDHLTDMGDFLCLLKTENSE
jgi:2-methylcitrate dehydratase PrpD